MKNKTRTIWLAEPVVADYAAAHEFLSLTFDEATTARLVQRLRKAKVGMWLAKDLLRASRLTLLERGNSHVSKDLKRIAKSKKLSPVLLVRGDGKLAVPLTVADGYHRICASWYLDENAPVACCIVNLPD